MDAIQPLPPLSALRAFEAAARHQSYTRAAQELFMTQAAISYQIKLLERQLGMSLFRRVGRNVALTETGARLSAAVIDAFAQMRAALAAERKQTHTVLSITALPTIAGNWLAPRLSTFQLAHPELAVRLDTTIAVVDLEEGGFDLALRFGAGRWPGLEAHFLMHSDFTVVCGPGLPASRRPKRAADLLKLPLYGRAAWWQQWFEAAGVDDPRLARVAKTDLGVQVFEVRAALQNGGAAVVTPAFFEEELRSGRLLQPFKTVVREQRSYWLVYPQRRAQSPKIAAFREWLLREAGGAAPERKKARRGA